MATTEGESFSNRGRWAKRITSSLVMVIVFLIAWHFYISYGMDSYIRDLRKIGNEVDDMLSISVNPFTNLVSIKFVMPSDLDDDNPFSELGSSIAKMMIQSIGPTYMDFVAKELNTQAREKYDIYAILVPYSVHISTERPKPEVLAKMREKREKRREEENRAKAKAEAERLQLIRSYVATNLLLENVHVAIGERFGRTAESVFGTIVNKGTKTLREVKVRFYFLDADGRRIGEKDFSPIYASTYSFGDNSPLRSGYRKDFGYNVEENAPSGWSKRVEAEIVDIEFLDE